MEITMNDSRLINVTQLSEFLKGSYGVSISLENARLDEKYEFIQKTVKRLEYSKLSKKEKRIVYLYLRKITGYKKAQLYRLIKRAINGKLKKEIYQRINPHKIYTSYDIKLLEKTDELHLRLSEKATIEILRRENEVFGHQNYQTISKVSHAPTRTSGLTITLANRNFFNPYLNYHRPCGFPTIQTDQKGKKRKVYDVYLTPYDALKRILGANKFLKPEQTFEKLDIIAYSHSDNKFAEIMREEERKLFNEIRKNNRNGGSII